MSDASTSDASTSDASSASEAGKADAISHVHQFEGASNATGSSVATLPSMGSPKAGNTLICFVEFQHGTVSVSSLSDSLGNVYAKAIGPVRGTGGTGGWTDEIWYALGIQGGASIVATATLTGSTAQRFLSCHEYSGISASQGFAQAGSNAFMGAGPKSTTPAPTTGITLIFSTVLSFGTIAAGSAFTTRSTLHGDLVQDRVVSSLGLYSADVTCSDDCLALAAFFRAQ
jgi:hypothetical protein